MSPNPSLRLPAALFGAGAAALGIAALVAGWRPTMRPVLIFGLDAMNWYAVAVFAAIAVTLVGMGMAAGRLTARRRTEWVGVLLGIVTFVAVMLAIGAAWWAYAWSGITDRTEIALDNGRSIVVVASFWHHCNLTVLQRDGIFVDTVLGSTLDTLPCHGDYSVVQRGDEVTLSGGGASMTVTLKH